VGDEQEWKRQQVVANCDDLTRKRMRWLK